MATLIDDNDADGQLGKLIWWLLSIRCTSYFEKIDSTNNTCLKSLKCYNKVVTEVANKI